MNILLVKHDMFYVLLQKDVLHSVVSEGIWLTLSASALALIFQQKISIIA
jgi:hypothetical protein